MLHYQVLHHQTLRHQGRSLSLTYLESIKRWAVYDHGYKVMPGSIARQTAWDILKTEFELLSPDQPFRGTITSGSHESMVKFWEDLEEIFEPVYASLKFEPWTYLSKEYALKHGSDAPTAAVGSRILIGEWEDFQWPSDKIDGSPPPKKLRAWNKAAKNAKNILDFKIT